MDQERAKQREKSRKYYEKIKNDPHLKQMRKQKEKENYIRRKKNKIKTLEEQEIQRQKWRENSQAYYRRKKKEKKIDVVYLTEVDNLQDVVQEQENIDPLAIEESNQNLHLKVKILSNVKVNFTKQELSRLIKGSSSSEH